MEVPPTRPVWKLREQDGSDATMGYEEVERCDQQDRGGQDFQSYDSVCEQDQIESVRVMLAGSGKPHAVLRITCDKGPSAQQCPGESGGRLTFRQVAFTGIALPSSTRSSW